MASLPGKVTINVTGVPETALYTLWSKAEDARKPDSVLKDKWATEAVERIENYDFAKFHLDPASAVFVPLRCRLLDRWTADFLSKHDSATVVNLACGLDSRALRLMPAYSHVRWVDVDLPELVTLRKQLVPDAEGDYTLVAQSVTEESWLTAIPADRPTVIVIEGLLMYLGKVEAERLLRRLLDHFPSGQLIFDSVGRVCLTMQKALRFLTATGSKFTWAVDNPRALEKLDSRLKFRKSVRHADYDGFQQVPNPARSIFLMYWYIPWIRNIQNNLLFDFKTIA